MAKNPPWSILTNSDFSGFGTHDSLKNIQNCTQLATADPLVMKLGRQVGGTLYLIKFLSQDVLTNWRVIKLEFWVHPGCQ